MIYVFTDDDDDEKLVQRALQGDGDAFDLLFKRYDPSVRRFIYRRVRNQQDVEDLVAVTWNKAWEKLSTLQKKARFKFWLMTIARNTAYDHQRNLPPFDYVRRQGRMEEDSGEENEELVDPMDVEEQVITQVVFDEAKKAAFSRMRSKQRKCFEYGVQEWKIEAIAEKLNLSVSTVETYISKAYRILYEELCKRLDGDQNNG